MPIVRYQGANVLKFVGDEGVRDRNEIVEQGAGCPPRHSTASWLHRSMEEDISDEWDTAGRESTWEVSVSWSIELEPPSAKPERLYPEKGKWFYDLRISCEILQ